MELEIGEDRRAPYAGFNRVRFQGSVSIHIASRCRIPLAATGNYTGTQEPA